MNLREALNEISPDFLNEQCARFWKKRGEYYPDYAVGELRRNLIDFKRKTDVPWLFLVYPFKEFKKGNDGEMHPELTIGVSVASVEELKKLCGETGTKEILRKFRENIKEISHLLMLSKIPFKSITPELEKYIPYEHQLHEVRWEMLGNMEIPSLQHTTCAPIKEYKFPMVDVVSAVLFDISNMGYSKDAYELVARKEKEISEMLKSKTEELTGKIEGQMEFLPYVTEDEFEEDEVQEEYRLWLFNLKEYTEALGDAIACIYHIADWKAETK